MATTGGEPFSGKHSEWADVKTECVSTITNACYLYIPQMKSVYQQSQTPAARISRKWVPPSSAMLAPETKITSKIPTFRITSRRNPGRRSYATFGLRSLRPPLTQVRGVPDAYRPGEDPAQKLESDGMVPAE